MNKEHARVVRSWIKRLIDFRKSLPRIPYGSLVDVHENLLAIRRERERFVKESLICLIDNKRPIAGDDQENVVLQIRIVFIIDLLYSYLYQMDNAAPDDYLGEIGVRGGGDTLLSFEDAVIFLADKMWKHRRFEWFCAVAMPDTIGMHYLNLVRTPFCPPL